MPRNPAFPNLWQALLLLGLDWVVLSAPLALLGVLHAELHPYLILVTVGLVMPLGVWFVLWAGYKMTRARLSEVFPLGGFSFLRAAAVVSATAGVWVLLDCKRALEMSAINAKTLPFTVLILAVPVVFAPVSEELLHRGLILRGFLSRYGKVEAVLLSAALFGIAHYCRGAGGLISASGFGIVVGYIYVRAQSLLPGLLVHATWNAMFTLSPRTNQALWSWLGGVQPAWVREPWYLMIGLALGVLGLWALSGFRFAGVWPLIAGGDWKRDRLKRSGLEYTQRAVEMDAERRTGGEADALFHQAYEKFEASAAAGTDALTLRCWGHALLCHGCRRTGEEARRLLAQAHEKCEAAAGVKPEWEAIWDVWGNVLWAQAKDAGAAEAGRLLAQAKLKFLQAESLKPGSGAYNVACLCAMLGEEDECREWLLKSNEPGTLVTYEHLAADPDLQSVRDRPWFRVHLAKHSPGV